MPKVATADTLRKKRALGTRDRVERLNGLRRRHALGGGDGLRDVGDDVAGGQIEPVRDVDHEFIPGGRPPHAREDWADGLERAVAPVWGREIRIGQLTVRL